jgi:hypothetical protein
MVRVTSLAACARTGPPQVCRMVSQRSWRTEMTRLTVVVGDHGALLWR